MKAKIAILATLVAFTGVYAQISNYAHPCSILAQKEVQKAKNGKIDINIKNLVIHDVDDNEGKKFSLKVLEGENYALDGKEIIIKPNFKGILRVNVQASDGKFKSNIFPLKVIVGDLIEDETKAIFVSADGDDSNNGAKETPVKTIQKAKELVAQKGTKLVYIRGGEYYEESPIVFSSSDSGTLESPIIYSAYNDEKVRITGSKNIPYSAFKKALPTQVEAIADNAIKNKIKYVNLRALGIENYGKIDHVGYGVNNKPLPSARLFVNGAAMNLARYPNIGNFDDVKTAKGANSFLSESGIVKKWKNTGDIWIDGSITRAWEWQKNNIESIDAEGDVTSKWDFYGNISTGEIAMFYFNIFEELDFPEEFFIDKENGILFVYFPASVNDDSEIRISQSEKHLLEINGADNLIFKNITFEGTRNGAIVFTRPSNNNTFDSCTIRSCGLEGIVVNGRYNRIVNCDIHDTGAAGISLTGGEELTLTPACNVADNCKIHDFSQERRAYNPGVSVTGVGQTIRHVEVYNGPHMGMVLKGTGHVVEYSDFHNAPCEYSDMLCIYMCTGGNYNNRGSIIRRNKFHDVNGTWKQSAGVYMDNDASGTIVEENYFYNNIAESSGWSVMIHGGNDNVVRRNVFVDCSYPFCISFLHNGYAHEDFEKVLKTWENAAKRLLNDTWLTHYPELRDYFNDEGKKATDFTYNLKKDEKGNVLNYWNMRTPYSDVFKDNIVFNTRPNVFAMPQTDVKKNTYNMGFYTFSNFRVINGKVQKCLTEKNNKLFDTDPGFENVADYNLQVAKGSPVIRDFPHLKSTFFKNIGLKEGKIGATK